VELLLRRGLPHVAGGLGRLRLRCMHRGKHPLHLLLMPLHITQLLGMFQLPQNLN
jgi:hypothetical protein